MIAPSILFKAADDKVVAINEADEEEFCIYEFEDSSKVLCVLLRQGASREELIDELKNEYDVSVDQASADVDEFITSLLTHKIIVQTT